MNSRLIVGTMSGTSADGVDAAIVRIEGRGTGMSATLVAHRHHPYSPALRQTIFGLRAHAEPIRLSDLARLASAISLAYAEAVKSVLAFAKVRPDEIAAVAAHGQTLFHDPPDTIQWIDPARLAAEIGCTVVSDFRRADCAAGGQGAPLVPFADYVLFRHPTKTRVLLNLGGIANITHLRAGGTLDQVLAFDTGPANCISDALLRAADPSGPGVDIDGATAATGKPIPALLERLRTESYFAKPPPKSTDVPEMVNLFTAARETVAKNASHADLVRSACELTATTLADAIHRFCHPFPDELIASGGGVRNATLLRLIRDNLGGIPLLTTDALDVSSESKEALAFALLAAATLDGEPSNVPSATGAKRAVVLGSITPFKA